MSALLSVTLEDTVQLFADGASYDDDGTIVSFPRKVFVSSKVPVAIGVRGFSATALKIAEELCRQADNDGVEQFHTTLFVLARDMAMNAHAIPSLNQFHFTIAMWLPDRGAVAYGLHCVPEFTAFPCHELTEMGTLAAYGTIFTVDELYQRGILPATGDPTAWAKSKGVEIMELMRSREAEPLPGRPLDHGSGYRIGGHVDLATVTKRGATIKRLRVWPDKVGERINPFASTPNVTPMAGRKSSQAELARKALRLKQAGKRRA